MGESRMSERSPPSDEEMGSPEDPNEYGDLSDSEEEVGDQDDADYDEGEPEGEPESEEDELVDESAEAQAEPEQTNRKRRAPIRVRLSRGREQRSSQRAAVADADADDGEEEADEEELDSEASETEYTSKPRTARQIARANRERGIGSEEPLELPTEDRSKRTKLSETELALRRSETARRRRNQSEKKLEDDKIETINRLLKKQAGRMRSSQRDEESPAEPAATPRRLKADEVQPMFRYISRVGGAVLAVPRSDGEAPTGAYDTALREAFGISTDKWAGAAAQRG